MTAPSHPPDPLQAGKATIDLIKSYGSLLEPNENAIRLADLNARLQMGAWRRQDEKELAQAEAQARTAELERQGRTMQRLLDLGSQQIEKAVGPISRAFADGFRIRQGLPPAPEPAPTPAQPGQPPDLQTVAAQIDAGRIPELLTHMDRIAADIASARVIAQQRTMAQQPNPGGV